MRRALPENPNILLIKPGAVGDLLQLSPVLRALKKTFPASSIFLIVGTEASASLFRHDPNVHEIIVYDRYRTPFLPLWKRLHGLQFDLVLNFQRSNLRSWFLASAAFPRRILVYRKARGRNVHAVENYLETLAPLGIGTADRELRMYLAEEDRAYARNILRSLGPDQTPVIAINPGATHAVNRWPTEHFAALADRIDTELGARVIIVGGPDDRPIADEIVARSAARPPSLAGATSLLQLGAVLEQCAAMVSGDTGPMHMATAVGTPVVALFGAADPDRTGPVGLGHRVIQARTVACVPCRSRTCSNPAYLDCMEKISEDDVIRALKTAMIKKR